MTRSGRSRPQPRSSSIASSPRAESQLDPRRLGLSVLAARGSGADHPRRHPLVSTRDRLPGDAVRRSLVRRRGRRLLLDPRRPSRGANAPHHVVDVARSRGLRRRADAARRPALDLHDADRLRGRRADRRLLDRLHGRRGRGAPLLRVHGALRLLDAPARPGREPAAAPRRLGARRPELLPADRLPPRAAAAPSPPRRRRSS